MGPPTTIDLTGDISRETSLRRSFPPRRFGQLKPTTYLAGSRTTTSSNTTTHHKHAGSAPQVRIFLHSLDGDLDREIVLSSDKRTFEFGRASNNPERNMRPRLDNAWIASPIVSRGHSRVFLKDVAESSIWLRDLGSTHGTYLNERSLADGKPRRLFHGDRIRLGVVIINGAATYMPRSFEVEYQWEDKYACPLWHQTRFDRGSRPSASSSIPTPADSPEQLASKTFSVPNGTDSECEEVTATGRADTARSKVPRTSLRLANLVDPRAPFPAKDAKEKSNVHIQVPATVAGMSQVPVVTFSDSEDDVPESLPIYKAPLSKRASKKSTPNPEAKDSQSSLASGHVRSSATEKPQEAVERRSPDYSPTYDNNASSSQAKASQRSSQPAGEEFLSDKEDGSEFDAVFDIMSEDDFLALELDENAPQDPHLLYGDDAEEAENILDDYPSFRNRTYSASSVSSDAGSSQAASSFQPGQNPTIRVPESSSSESDGSDIDDGDDTSAANQAVDEPEKVTQESHNDHQDAQPRSQIRDELDVASVIAMLRTQPPPIVPDTGALSNLRHPRCHDLGRNDIETPRPTRYVIGDDFDSSPAVYSPPALRLPYAQGPFAGGALGNMMEPHVNLAGPDLDFDANVDDVPAYGGHDLTGAEIEPFLSGRTNIPSNYRPHAADSYHTAPEPSSEGRVSRSTRVSIADIVNAESSFLSSHKRKADEITQATSTCKIATGMSYYEMDDNELLHVLGKPIEADLDSAAQRQLDREVRAASSDPNAHESHETLPDAQPRDDPILVPEDTDDTTFNFYDLETTSGDNLRKNDMSYDPSKTGTAEQQAARERAEEEELAELQRQLAKPVRRSAKNAAEDAADEEADADADVVRLVDEDEDRSPQLVIEDSSSSSDLSVSDHEDSPARKKRRLSPSATRPAESSRLQTRTRLRQSNPTRRRFNVTWRSFVTGAVTGAAAVLGAAAAIVATVPPEVRDEVMREW